MSERTVTLMEDAVRLLEPPFAERVRFALTRFHAHVAAGELERAWDELSDAGGAADANVGFWRNLAEAASELGLEERRVEAARRARDARS